MTRCTRGWLLAAVLVAVVGVIGCDWESSGDEEAWDESYNWLDFSGMYADEGQGVFVKDATMAFDITSTLVVGESVGTGNGSSSTFSGGFAHAGIVAGSVLLSAGPINFVDDGVGGLTSPADMEGVGGGVVTHGNGAETSFNGQAVNNPIIAGSFSVQAGGIVFTDDGEGTLDSSGGSGTIVYGTGSWSIQLNNAVPDLEPVSIAYRYSFPAMAGSVIYSTGAFAINLQGLTLVSGTPITVTYRYTQSTSDSDVSGNTGNAIYTMTILQTGQKLRLIDSNGNTYEGSIYDVNSTAADLTEMPVSETDVSVAQGEVVASFYAEGQAYGQWVTLEGTFGGNLFGTTENTLFDRHMNGTWRESGGKVGVFFGVASSSAVPLPLPAATNYWPPWFIF